jgi:hypothetical protein
MPSTRRINYSVRANKHIERRMLMEVLRRLDRLPPRLTSYRYVGFGGIFFTDFVHAHQHLGLRELISIEHSGLRERFDFNRPLACIDIRFGGARHVLPELLAELSMVGAPAVFWLDFDGPLTRSICDDIAHLATNVTEWSFLAVTVNADPGEPKDRLAEFHRRFEETAPPDITSAAQLANWKLAQVSNRMLVDAIDSALVARNAATPPSERLRYQQLILFHYADGAKMLTTGGIFHLESQAHLITEATAGLPQLRPQGTEALLVDAPVLTPREVRNLSQQLPTADGNAPSSPGVAESDALRFANLYRHYPLYAQVELL